MAASHSIVSTPAGSARNPILLNDETEEIFKDSEATDVNIEQEVAAWKNMERSSVLAREAAEHVVEGTREHEAVRNRAYVRELDEQRKAQAVLDALAHDVLPDELLMTILAHVVTARLPEVHLRDGPGRSGDGSLSIEAAFLLGASPAAATLVPKMKQAILEAARVRLTIPFTRQPTGEVVAQPPALLTHLPHPIRHLRIRINTEVRSKRLSYPIQLLRPTRHLATLALHFPNLDSFSILLAFDVLPDYAFNPAAQESAELDKQCLCGYTARSTYRKLIIDLVSSLRDNGPGKRKFVQVSFTHYGSVKLGPEISVVPSSLTSEQILEQATNVEELMPVGFS